jgi:hypothetical protein
VAREGQLRQGVRGEGAHFEHLRTCADRRSTGDAAHISDADDARRGGFGDVVQAEQRCELDLGVDLLHAFAHRGGGGRFVVVDESAREAPKSVARLDAAPAKHDSSVDLDHDGGRHLGVAPENVTVVGTRFELAAFDDLHHERSAAVGAEMPHV